MYWALSFLSQVHQLTPSHVFFLLRNSDLFSCDTSYILGYINYGWGKPGLNQVLKADFNMGRVNVVSKSYFYGFYRALSKYAWKISLLG